MQFERCWYIHTHIRSYIQTLRSHYHKQDNEHIYAAPSASSCLCIFPPSSFPAHSHSLTTTNLLSVIIGQFAFFRVLCKWNHTVHTPFLSVFFWLTIIILRFILLVACINISFLFVVEQCFIVWIYHNLFRHSLLMTFELFPNKAIMNIVVQVYMWTYISFFFWVNAWIMW